MDDPDAAAAARWAEAARTAEGITDYGISRALRTYFLVYLPVGVLILTGIGSLLSVLLFGDIFRSWSTRILLGLLLSGLGACIGGIVYAATNVKPQVRPQRPWVLSGLAKDEQKRIRQQVYGRIPLVPQERVIARGAAVQLRQNVTRQLLIAPGYLLAFGPQLVTAPADLQLWWFLVLGLLVVSLALATWQFHRTGRFLERTSSVIVENP